MFFDSGYNLCIPRASIFKSHGQNSARGGIDVNGCDSLVVDFGNVINQIVPFIDFIQSAVIYESYNLRDLTDHKLLILTNLIPHYQVFGNCLHQNVVLVALLDC